MEFFLIGLAVAMVGGLMLSRLTRLIHLPAVTAYLVAGLLLGPFCVGALQVQGLGFNSLAQVETFKIVSQTALGFIAFSMGNEFRLKQLKAMGKSAIIIGILQAVITTIVVDIALIALHLCFPTMISIPCAITLGAIASATAPAATMMVVRQYKADGPMTRLLMLVVAIDDAVGLLLFSVSFGIANALASGAVSILAVVVEPIVEIVLSLALGAAMGWLLHRVEKFFHSRSKRMTISIAFVMLTVGLSMLEFKVGPVNCGFSLLLVCMMTGTIFCNVCPTSEELMERVENWTMPLNVLFFVLSGAELDLNVLAQPVTLIVGVVYIIARSLGKYYGAASSCSMTHQPKPIVSHLGITLLPQAGVALGMAMTAATLADGALARNVVLFSVLVYELVGPALTKRSLTAVGEIRPEGRTSARKLNEAS
ncbi:MAG: cation:proton antiporter [Candidatus Ventricola sp.]|nr:cation:proton antiporter [Clostridiales bacterium]MDY3764741.1 cation:proton antiporter [Candidatus Ventricola sp.]MDY4542177.1 cation:proton antiporter [Candidatus Ventricola sp.]MDY4855387.1 cation:proton antiporter [Candidatus Ventricola sp.]